MRMYHQYLSSGRKGAFVTLTYSPKTVPVVLDDKGNVHGTLVKKDLQDYMKRFRFFCNTPFKYYMVGEYGSKNKRPHYHICMFGITPDEWKIVSEFISCENKQTCDIGFDKRWGKGLVSVSHDFGVEAGAYAAKYATKVIRARGYSYFPRIAPFQLQSLGIGKTYAEENAEEIKKNSIWFRAVSKKAYRGITKKS